MLTLYHGSPSVIEKPVFGEGNPNNDYGLGFYCTESVELAREWACSSESSGYANRYSINMEGLSVLSLTGGEYHILNWLAILLENRKGRMGGSLAQDAKTYIAEHFLIDYKKYDVIKGYRADDSYFSFAMAFLNNTISLSQLESAMVLGKLGEQITLRSQEAFNKLVFEAAVPAEKEIYYPKKLARDTVAREAFRQDRARGRAVNEIYMIDIIRERWKDDDNRLQRVVLG